jgi:hypothetical protein
MSMLVLFQGNVEPTMMESVYNYSIYNLSGYFLLHGAPQVLRS